MSNAIKTTVLLGVLTGLLLWIGQWLGGPQGLVVALVFAAAMNFGSYWFADRIVLAMYGARELSEQDAPELFRIVRELAAGIPMPMPRGSLAPRGSRWRSLARVKTRPTPPGRASCTGPRSWRPRSRRSPPSPAASRCRPVRPRPISGS